jgi:hypothetical protein
MHSSRGQRPPLLDQRIDEYASLRCIDSDFTSSFASEILSCGGGGGRGLAVAVAAAGGVRAGRSGRQTSEDADAERDPRAAPGAQ